MKVPCLSGGAVDSRLRLHGGGYTRGSPYNDKKLRQRMDWITACGSVAYFQLWAFSYNRINNNRYFIVVQSIWVPRPPDQPWPVEMLFLQSPTCYYLGTFPNYWNMNTKKMERADQTETGFSFPVGSKPGLLGEYIPEQTIKDIKELASSFDRKDLEWLFYSGIIPGEASDEERERLDKFRRDYDSAISKIGWSYEKVKYNHYIMQMWSLDATILKYKECIKKNWPVAPKIPRIIVKTPIGPADWPGIPMDQLTLPTPTAPSAGPSNPPNQTLNLTVTFGIKDGVLYNALDLILSLKTL